MRGAPSSHPLMDCPLPRAGIFTKKAYFWGFHVGLHIPAPWVASGHYSELSEKRRFPNMQVPPVLIHFVNGLSIINHSSIFG